MVEVATDVRKITVVPFITENVSRKATVYTDEFPSYNHLARICYRHERVNHGSKVYVVGNIHTNTIEGFWSLVKRGISGVYHAVSLKYLQSYVSEYAFRYNHRDDETPMFQIFLNQI